MRWVSVRTSFLFEKNNVMIIRSYILISFSSGADISRGREGKKGSPQDATASHVVSINSSIQNPLV
jgi:hypothetical protein